MTNKDLDVQIELINLETVKDAIQELGDSITQHKVVDAALKKGAQYLMNKGRLKLRQRMKNRKGVTGNLLKSFSYRIKKRKFGALIGFKEKGRHAHLVSQGTRKRYTRKGQYRGFVVGNAFWEDTRSKETPRAMLIILNQIKASINNIKNRYRNG
jgi:hypothetical protein